MTRLQSSPNDPDADSGASLAELRAQILARAADEPAPTRAEVGARQRLILGLALAVSLLIFLAWGGLRPDPRPLRLVVETTVGSAILAVGVAIVALGRGGSMLGRPKPWLVLVVLSTPVALFAWRVLTTTRYPGMAAEWSTRPGLRCLLLSGMLAITPLLGLLWLRRGSDPVHPRMTAASFGAAAGAASWVVVDLWCPVGYVPHLLLGHVAPVVLLTVLSALLGSRVLRLRKP
ncbi:MAG TPA: NrsF family protein [Polyangiaceae bacterium]|nr:NrsF family protein [Polyangiaceae bacterium]